MPRRFLYIPILIVTILAAVFYFYFTHRIGNARTRQVFQWLRDPDSLSGLMMKAGTRCGDAPFIFPTDGLVGFIWDDSFRFGHHHQGIDIFGGTEVGITPVIAAYPGYLTRETDWKSAVIVRVPDDPLQPRRQIWLYYTHMADANGNSYISSEFPPGTSEVFIEAGTLLGYQGNYSGDPNNPVGVHLHFSIVKDDNFGHFKNELDINNTYDPSPYLGLFLNARKNTDTIPVCNNSINNE